MNNIPIRSFSKLSGIESSTLRYWESIGVFAPIGRNLNTKYRFYSKSQLISLIYVKTLCTLKVPLKIIAKLSLKRDPDSLLRLFEIQEKVIDREMSNFNRNYSIIHTRRELINQGMTVDDKLVHVVPREDMAIVFWPEVTHKENDAFVEALGSILSIAVEHHIDLGFPIGGLYNNMDSFEESPIFPNRFFSIDPSGYRKQDAGDYLTSYYRGNYKDINDAPKRMRDYAEENSLELFGPVYVEYLIDGTCTNNPDQYLARYSVAVKKSS